MSVLSILGVVVIFGVIAFLSWLLFEVLIDDGNNQLLAYSFVITTLYIVIGVLWALGIKFPKF